MTLICKDAQVIYRGAIINHHFTLSQLSSICNLRTRSNLNPRLLLCIFCWASMFLRSFFRCIIFGARIAFFCRVDHRCCCLKVSKFQNEFMKSSFLPKYQPKIVRISALHRKNEQRNMLAQQKIHSSDCRFRSLQVLRLHDLECMMLIAKFKPKL